MYCVKHAIRTRIMTHNIKMLHLWFARRRRRTQKTKAVILSTCNVYCTITKVLLMVFVRYVVVTSPTAVSAARKCTILRMTTVITISTRAMGEIITHLLPINDYPLVKVVKVGITHIGRAVHRVMALVACMRVRTLCCERTTSCFTSRSACMNL